MAQMQLLYFRELKCSGKYPFSFRTTKIGLFVNERISVIYTISFQKLQSDPSSSSEVGTTIKANGCPKSLIKHFISHAKIFRECSTSSCKAGWRQTTTPTRNRSTGSSCCCSRCSSHGSNRTITCGGTA